MNAPGDIASQQGRLIVIATVLMLLIIVPVMILTVVFAWRYRHSNKEAEYAPDWDHSTALELVIWAAPLLIIIALGAVTWISTHTLDPFAKLRRLDADREIPQGTQPLVVEAVALDWKWLFFYPGQGVATVNELVAPVDRPITFHITSESVMNSFFIPALAGQIYAMPGMQTELHAVMNSPGNYEGFSSNYSGRGYSDMRFRFHAVSESDFDAWVAKTRKGGGKLDAAGYLKLAEPSVAAPVARYAAVAPGLYDRILNRCVANGAPCMAETMMADDMKRRGGTFGTATGPAQHGGREAIPSAPRVPASQPIPIPVKPQGDNEKPAT